MKRFFLIISVFLVIAALVLTGGYCANRYYNDIYLPDKNIREADAAQKELIASIRPDIESALQSTDTSSSAEPFRVAVGEDILSACSSVNGDTVAWLTIPGTNIDFPVMQCEDNDFYLHNGADGQFNSGLGCPFLDYRCESDLRGFNSIIYGHHMVDDMMFSDIAKFADKSYFAEHDRGVLVLPGEAAGVKFFAYLSVPSRSPVYHTVFMTPSDRDNYIELLFAEASYTQSFTKDDLKAMPDPHFLLLSTCTFETEESRGVLVGVF